MPFNLQLLWTTLSNFGIIFKYIVNSPLIIRLFMFNRAIELIMDKLHDSSSLLEFMPESQSTVLHYVCIHGNYQVCLS